MTPRARNRSAGVVDGGVALGWEAWPKTPSPSPVTRYCAARVPAIVRLDAASAMLLAVLAQGSAVRAARHTLSAVRRVAQVLAAVPSYRERRPEPLGSDADSRRQRDAITGSQGRAVAAGEANEASRHQLFGGNSMRFFMFVLVLLQLAVTAYSAGMSGLVEGGASWERVTLMVVQPVAALGLRLLAALGLLLLAALSQPSVLLVRLVMALLAINIVADAALALSIALKYSPGDWRLPLIFAAIPLIGLMYAVSLTARKFR